MFIDPTLKMFFILIAGIILTNMAWILYISGIEDELSIIYKLINFQTLSSKDKKKLTKIAKRRKSK